MSVRHSRYYGNKQKQYPKHGYYTVGNQMAIVRRRLEPSDPDTLEPTEDAFEEILIDYTSFGMENITDEDSEVPVSKRQSLALVNYVKARYFQELGDEKRSEYYMREFYKMLDDLEDANRSASGRSFPRGPTANLGEGL